MFGGLSLFADKPDAQAETIAIVDKVYDDGTMNRVQFEDVNANDTEEFPYPTRHFYEAEVFYSNRLLVGISREDGKFMYIACGKQVKEIER
jgi:hypothetical protein